ncbi:MAG TPA: peroxiredoxin [Polyangiales bacterium]|jgi:peroxiredoxin Q/BCP|nr:peroxiredoxin [Polyangiales bacterium]
MAEIRATVLLVAALLLLGCGSQQSEAASSRASALAVGQLAPDFSAHDQNGKPVSLSALHGKHVVLYFYPKDETHGCTIEAEAFRDTYEQLTKLGATIVGVSADDDASHKAFAANHGLPFTLVSDRDGALAAKYGVPMHLGMISRQSFVIAPDGRLKRIFRDVDVSKHASEIAAAVQ